MHERLRDAFLGWWGRTVVAHRWIVCVAALLLTAGSVWITVDRLTMQTDRSLLVDEHLPWNASYLRYKDAFARWGDVLVVIDRGVNERAQSSGEAERFARALSALLTNEPAIASVIGEYDALPEHARVILSHWDEDFAREWGEIEKSRVVLESVSVSEYLRATLGQLAGAVSGPAGNSDEELLGGLEQLKALLDRMTKLAHGWNGSLVNERSEETRFLTTESGRYVLLSVALEGGSDGSVSGVGQGINIIRQHLRDLQSTRSFAGIDVGVTGIGAIEHDETEQSIRDSTWTSALAFVLIAVLMLVVFRGWFVPTAIALCLLVGIMWSFGFATLAVGHLQVLSVVFTAILLGLGVDFGLHIVARLELARETHAGLGEVLARVFRAIGPGMITGAVTTSAAFAVMLLTEFRGVAEMGLIAGGGILLCMMAMLALLPMLLSLRGDWRQVVRHRSGGENARFAHGRLNMIDQHPRLVIAIAAIVVIVGAFEALQTRYDPNLMHLHPPGIESVEWEQRLIADSGHSAWIGLSVANSLKEAQVKTLAFLQRESEISSVGGVGELFHPRREQRRARIAAAMPGEIRPTESGSREDTVVLLGQVVSGIDLLGANVDEDVREAVERLKSAAGAVRMLLSAEDGVEAWDRANGAYARDRAMVTTTWAALADEREPMLSDLPEPVRALNTGVDGQLLLRVYPVDRDDASVLAPERLGGFVGALREVDANVIGPAVQVYESTRLIARAYCKATLLALCVIVLVLVLDFRSAGDAICALLPVLLGFVLMFASMGATGLPLNFANIIVMPVIFGIGVDAGVHMVHRWREDPAGIPRGLSGSTGRGIGLTMLTTMIGFGCLGLAQHRGIRGLGITMVIGLVFTLAACYTVLPAVLRLRMDRSVIE